MNELTKMLRSYVNLPNWSPLAPKHTGFLLSFTQRGHAGFAELTKAWDERSFTRMTITTSLDSMPQQMSAGAKRNHETILRTDQGFECRQCKQN